MEALDWHALVGLGSDGQPALADGDSLARGVHLLWSLQPALGFPLQGYDVWRRPHREPEWACIEIGPSLLPPPGGVGWDWTWFGIRLRASPGPVQIEPDGCGKLDALLLPGAQEFEIRAAVPAIAVRASGMGIPPLVEVCAQGGSGTGVVARRLAMPTVGGGWALTVWASAIVGVRFIANDLRLCQFCFGQAIESGGGWRRLTSAALLLPVVASGTRNDAASVHGPAASRAAAQQRLSPTLAAPVRDSLADGIAGDLRELAVALLRDGADAALPTAPTATAGARTPPQLGMGSAVLLALAAIDPDVSRMLGLYWHDPVDSGRWDYKVVAHHGPVRWPSRRVGFEALAAGPLPGSMLQLGGVRFVGSGGLSVVVGAGRGALLRFEVPRAGTVAGLHLNPPVPALTVHVETFSLGLITAWHGGQAVGAAPAIQRTVTLEHAAGIDALTWAQGQIDLLDVELYTRAGVVGDLEAWAWNLAPVRPAPVRRLNLGAAAADCEATRLRVDGTLDPANGVVGLDWDEPAETPPIQDTERALRVLVARAVRGTGSAPSGTGPFELRNAEHPALAFASPSRAPGRWPGPALPPRWTERGQAPGWSAWRVRGIDAFGRLGPWSEERVVELRPTVPPPPPDAVSARYLDVDDPHLSDADRALVAAGGSGLWVEWSWPASRRLQAPQVEAAGEFRIYLRRGDPNLLQGSVLGITDGGDRSSLRTDLAWAGTPDALAGELLRQPGASFEIVRHARGNGIAIEVRHASAPTRRPGSGPSTIQIAAGGRARTDLSRVTAYDRRLHAEPAGALARVTTRITAVHAAAGVATLTLADPLPVTAGEVLPGLLASRGIVYPVTRQVAGSAQLEVRAPAQADGSSALPAVGDPCTLWAGGRYRVWLAGVQLVPAERAALALGLVVVTAADGDGDAADDPRWSLPGRGGLGGRAGSEGPASRVVRVQAPRHSTPPPVVARRPPEQEGDIPADIAEPADWYGRARYTLHFDAVPGCSGYRVLRASVAALANCDRLQRQAGSGPYAGGPFDDAGASLAWLAEAYPTLGVADLVADLSSHPDPLTVLATWRDWAAWYYPARSNRQLMELAERPGNETAFMAAHAGTIAAPPYADTLDGRGLGRFLYRVRSVDASGNAGPWSGAFAPVQVRDVTPPKTPTLLTATATDNCAHLAWLAGTEADLAGYRIWRADEPSALADLRRVPPTASVSGRPGERRVDYIDSDLAGLRNHHYRVAAVDSAGNVSEPTPVVAVRVPDTRAPNPPAWERAEWVRVAADGTIHDWDDPSAAQEAAAVALCWLADEPGLSATVERQRMRQRLWRAVATGLGPLDDSRPEAPEARRFEWLDADAGSGSASYRIRLTDAAGNTNWRHCIPVTVSAP